jgi:hypothetical protein
VTGLVPDDGYPPGTRFIVRRERPHPGAQLSLFDTIEGMRHQVMATDTPPGDPAGGSIQYLEASHRAHARVEDRIRTGKDTGFGRFPSRVFAINQAWLELALTGIDLIAWTQMLLLDGELAAAEPKKAALPAPARRRPAHPHRPPDAAADRRNLAPGQQLSPPRSPASTDSHARSADTHTRPRRHCLEDPGQRAVTSARPDGRQT